MSAAIQKQESWTLEKLAALPERGYDHEVVNQELVMSPKNDFFHGHIASRLSRALMEFTGSRRLGVVVDSSTGFQMRNDNVRAPDLSFISRKRMQELNFTPKTRAFFPGAPDLAVEILSPHNRSNEIGERLADFFSSGTEIAWVIDPDRAQVKVYHGPGKFQTLSAGTFLDGEQLLPGSRFAVADLFKEWDWD